MANLNKVFLAGNLTRDPELRYAPNGTAVTTFSIAVNSVFSTPAGKKEEVSFVRVVCWAKLAQNCGEYLFKGRPVLVEGRLKSRSWEAKDGTKRSTIEVIAQSVQFLGRGRSAEAAASGEAPAQEAVSESGAEAVFDIGELEGLAAPEKQDEEVPF